MKTLCLIPARGGSVRVKHKNIRQLNGIPLIIYSLRDAQKSQNIDLSVVTTDDEKIAEVTENEGFKTIRRPVEYAQVDSPIYFALRHAVKKVAESEGWIPDIVVWLQPNVPFREPGLVDGVVKRLIDNFDRADSVITVYEVDQYPEWMRVINNDFLEFRENTEEVFYRAQEIPKYYIPDGSVSAIKSLVLMDESIPIDNPHFFMGKMMGYVHEFPYTVEVDEEKDFFLLEYIIDRKLIDSSMY